MITVEAASGNIVLASREAPMSSDMSSDAPSAKPSDSPSAKPSAKPSDTPCPKSCSDDANKKVSSPEENPLESIVARLKGKTARKDVVKRARVSALIRELDAGFTKQGLIFREFMDLSIALDSNGVQHYPWAYGKVLAHHSTLLMPTKADVDKIISFIEQPTEEKITSLPRFSGAVRRHEDLLGGTAIEPHGIDALGGRFADIVRAAQIQARSRAGFSEMIEVYAMALLRDKPFSTWDTDSDVIAIKDELIAVGQEFGQNFPTPTIANLFRGTGGDEGKGAYISQLLLQDFSQGNLQIPQLYLAEADADSNRLMAGYLEMAQGVTPGGKTAQSGPTRIDRLRVLGSVVHNDPAYALYFNAAMQLLGPVGFDGLDASDIHSSNFLDTGGPDLLSMIGHVTRPALRAAWSVKWASAMKIRPEAFAANCQTAENLTTEAAALVPGFADLKQWVSSSSATSLLGKLKAMNLSDVAESNLFLPLIYPEGSPTHPSMPAGHATVAGACCTILKAMLKTHNEDGSKRLWADLKGLPMKVSATDSTVLEADVDSGETIVGEINKLASNVALGRNVAGVHYRCDGDCGLKIGERVAEEFLRTHARHYYPELLQSRISFTYERFDGTLARIAAM